MTRTTRLWRLVGPAIVVMLSFLLAAVFLGWLADVTGRYGAQTLLARAVQQQTGVAQRPSVHIRGRFFAPQMVRGRYDHVQIEVRSLVSGPLRIDSVRAEGYGVHIPFHNVLVRDIHRVLIDRTTERAVLTFADIDSYLRLTGRPLTVTPAGNGQATLTGTVSVLGKSISASAVVTLGAADGALTIRPVQFKTGLGGLERASRLLLQQRFSALVPLQALPFGQRITAVTIVGSQVRIRADGSAVVIVD